MNDAKDIGLYYVHGRWWNQDTGVYLSPDDSGSYLYYENDPVNNPKDIPPPRNAIPVECQWGVLDFLNPRDLTCWLYREMKHNLTDPDLQDVRNIVQSSHSHVLSGVFTLYASRHLPPLPFIGVYLRTLMWGSGIAQTGVGAYEYWAAYPKFYALVGDRQRWDFKHKIERDLGPGITLCASFSCREDVEYSVPGNIHFGFVAREGGYSGLETQLGAGYAEMTDPAHDPNQLDKYKGPYEGRPEAFFDTPEDNRAVAFGIRLYDKYAGGRGLTFPVFQMELMSALPHFATKSPERRPVKIAHDWPYWPGYFDPTK